MKASLTRLVGVSVSTLTCFAATSCSTLPSQPRHPASDGTEASQVPDNQVQGTLINWQVVLNSNRLDQIAEAYDCFAYTACVQQSSTLDAAMNVMTIQIKSTRPQMLELAARCVSHSYPALQSISEKMGDQYQPVVLTPEQISAATPGLSVPSIVAMPKLNSDEQDSLYRRAQQELWARKFDQMLAVFTDEFKMDSNGCTIHFDPALKDKVLTNQLDHTITFPVPPVDDNLCNNFRTVRHEYEHSYQTAFAAECTKTLNFSGFSQHHERERSAHLNDVRNISNYCQSEAGTLNYEYRTNFHFLLQYRTDNVNAFSRTAAPITGALIPTPGHAAPVQAAPVLAAPAKAIAPVAPTQPAATATPEPVTDPDLTPVKKPKRRFFQFWRD